jgi:hypothetical protein
MKLLDIHLEFSHAFGKEAYTFAAVKYWIHELKTGRTIQMDETQLGRSSIQHIDMLILKNLTKSVSFQFNH